MANPASRQELKNYCLRRLGEPVVDVNVDDEQVEDRIDDALKFYQDYHYDGTERLYLKHQVTQDDVNNNYIEVNDAKHLNEIITGLRTNLSIYEVNRAKENYN